jgi:hypothetical protein
MSRSEAAIQAISFQRVSVPYTITTVYEPSEVSALQNPEALGGGGGAGAGAGSGDGRIGESPDGSVRLEISDELDCEKDGAFPIYPHTESKGVDANCLANDQFLCVAVETESKDGISDVEGFSEMMRRWISERPDEEPFNAIGNSVSSTWKSGRIRRASMAVVWTLMLEVTSRARDPRTATK